MEGFWIFDGRGLQIDLLDGSLCPELYQWMTVSISSILCLPTDLETSKF